jgi:hypothetical protein
VLNGETINTNFIIFGLTRSGFEPTINNNHSLTIFKPPHVDRFSCCCFLVLIVFKFSTLIVHRTCVGTRSAKKGRCKLFIILIRLSIYLESIFIHDNVMISIMYIHVHRESGSNYFHWPCYCTNLNTINTKKQQQENLSTWGGLNIVSEWLLFNANSPIFQLYHGKNKLIFNEMMMRSVSHINEMIY